MPRAMEANAAPASTASRRRKSSPTGQSSTEGAATSAMSAARLEVVRSWGDENPVLPVGQLEQAPDLEGPWNEERNMAEKLGEGDCSLAIARFARVHRHTLVAS